MTDYEAGDAVRSTIDLSKVWRETKDPINHPDHYTQGPIELIEALESRGWGKEWTLANAIKYIWRAGEKNDEIEDLKKARWYIDRRLEQLAKE